MKQEVTSVHPNRSSTNSASPKPRITAGLILVVMGIVMYLTTSSCGTSEDKKSTSGVGSTPTYNQYQQIFCLNMLSDISGMYNGHYGDTITNLTRNAVTTVLNSPQAIQLIGQWRLVWGPVVYASAGKYETPKARNTMLVAQNITTPSMYVIAIAGTDFSSVYDWISEDFNVLNIKYWNRVCTDVYDTTWDPIPEIPFTPFVSAATARGLSNLMYLKDTTLANSPNLLAFLKTQTQQQTSMTIWTTGHSLGGALSPALACYLYDTKDSWATKTTINMNCLAVAGASPGNQAFSNHYNQSVPNTIRVWNARDCVPHGFEFSMLQVVDTIYQGDNLPTSDTIQNVISAVSAAITLRGIAYRQLYPTQDTMFTSDFYHGSNEMNGTTSNPDTSFFSQLLCQHVPSYPHYFGVDSFQTCVQRLMGYKNPYFSGGYSPAPILAKQAVAVQTATKK